MREGWTGQVRCSQQISCLAGSGRLPSDDAGAYSGIAARRIICDRRSDEPNRSPGKAEINRSPGRNGEIGNVGYNINRRSLHHRKSFYRYDLCALRSQHSRRTTLKRLLPGGTGHAIGIHGVDFRMEAAKQWPENVFRLLRRPERQHNPARFSRNQFLITYIM